MEQFRITEEGKAQARRKVMLRILLMVTPIMVVFMLKDMDSFGAMGVAGIAGMVVGVVVVNIVVAIMATKKVAAIYQSFVLTVDGRMLRREQDGVRDMLLHFDDVARIYRKKDGSYMIRGKDKLGFIFVFPGVERREELEALLGGIVTVEPPEAAPWIERNMNVVLVVSIAALLSIMLSTNKVLVGMGIAVELPLLAWSFIDIMKNRKSYPQSGRLMILVPLMIVVFAVIAYAKLMGLSVN